MKSNRAVLRSPARIVRGKLAYARRFAASSRFRRLPAAYSLFLLSSFPVTVVRALFRMMSSLKLSPGS